MSRKLVLVLVAVFAVVLAAAVYVAHARTTHVTPGAKADCATPAPPPPEAPPPPKLPGFSIEAACGAGAAKPAPVPPKKKQ